MAECTDPCVVLALGHLDRCAALAGSPQQGEGFWLGRQVGAAFSRGSALLRCHLHAPAPIPVLPCLPGTLRPTLCLQDPFPFGQGFL